MLNFVNTHSVCVCVCVLAVWCVRCTKYSAVDCVTVRFNAPVAWSVTVRTRAAVGVANTLPTYLLELVTVASLSFAF